MRIGIVSTEFAGFDPLVNRPGPEARRIATAAERAGAEVLLIDPQQIYFTFGGGGRPRVLYAGGGPTDALETLDALLVKRTRHMTEQIGDLVEALDAFQPAIEIFDPPGCYRRPTSKVDSYLLREREGLPHPLTLVGLSEELDQANMILEPPVLMKPTHGTQGMGVKLLKTDVALANELRKVRFERSEIGPVDENYGVHLQRHVDFDQEYRIFVIGGKAIGIAERVREAGWSTGRQSSLPAADFRGCSEDPAASALAERAAIVHGFSFAGVDVVRKGEELFLLECNRNPQFSKFEKAVELDVASMMVDFMIRKTSGSPIGEV